VIVFVSVQGEANALVFPQQLLLYACAAIKVQRIVECESDLLSHHRESELLRRYRYPQFTCKVSAPTLLWARG